MRITGGTFRSRALRAPPGQATRPTSDRVREALFGILASAGAIESARVLDLYAGSGALALEALSRGASEATVVESARPALDAIRRNVEALGVADRVHVIAAAVRPSIHSGVHGGSPALARIARGGPFDLVFADPPWALADTGEPLALLVELARLGAFEQSGAVGRLSTPGRDSSRIATIVLEHAARSKATLDDDAKFLTRAETRRYGDTALTFYKPAILGPAGAAPGQEGAGTPSE
jgi:16S rRNA (guanine966-N2)-methyltransferase